MGSVSVLSRVEDRRPDPSGNRPWKIYSSANLYTPWADNDARKNALETRGGEALTEVAEKAQ
jgi:hypothetical protein